MLAPSRQSRVSVIIPLFNHAKYIEKAIESVISQGDVVRELIVIDDGSKDDSLKIARDLGRSSEKIRVLSQPNQGAHATINRGIEESSGDLIAILNSDDFYLNGRLDTLVDFIDANPHVSLVGSKVRFVDQFGTEQANDWYLTGLAEHDRLNYEPAAFLNANIFVTTSNFLVRRRVFEEIGKFSSLRYAHDLEFLMRLLARGRHVLIHEKSLVAYRFHATNTIKENHSAVRAELALIGAFFLQLSARNLTQLNWHDIDLFQGILKKHALSDAVFICLVHFLSNPIDSLEKNPFDCNEKLRGAVASVI